MSERASPTAAPGRNQQQQIRLNLGGGNVVTVPLQRQTPNGIATASGPNGPVNIRVVQIEPLVPQPISETTTHTNTDPHHHHDIHHHPENDRFKCDICYEFLNDPVSCGKCSSRFCSGCLSRVRRDEIQRDQKFKCPMCRVEYEHMIPDRELSNDLKNGPTLPCRFDGCPQIDLFLSDIADHEKNCEYVPMRCRYASYGCSWKGKRGMIEAHEKYSCKLAPMNRLVDEIRQTSTRIEIIGQQAVGAMRMQEVQRQNTARDQMKSIVDVFQLLQYCQCLTCSTPHFFSTRDRWVSYWKSSESRAAVANFLLFSPIAIISVKIGAEGMINFCVLMDNLLIKITKMTNEQSNSTTTPLTITAIASSFLTPQMERHLEDAFLGVTAGMLGVMCILLNFIDERSSKQWKGVKIQGLGRPPIVGDVIAISSFTFYVDRYGILWRRDQSSIFVDNGDAFIDNISCCNTVIITSRSSDCVR